MNSHSPLTTMSRRPPVRTKAQNGFDAKGGILDPNIRILGFMELSLYPSVHTILYKTKTKNSLGQ